MVLQKVRQREFVILSPSPIVILSEAKDLGFRLRVNSAKNLALSAT